MASAVATAGSFAKFCFNSQCKELRPERPRKGWVLYSGDFAELCDRCGCAYEEGRFCETFHLNAAGWRCCELCAKRAHCGCIVSSPGFMLLDRGGIECMVCSRKNGIMAYFPSITPPEGLPLKVLNVKGKEWIVQFRFWPNNNSRMYVLEGVTPCLQATPLRAGVIDANNGHFCLLILALRVDSLFSYSPVTFSRLEPEGNLVMDFRKATTEPDQVEPTKYLFVDKI